GRCGGSGRARMRCWPTAGSRCCTAAAGWGWARSAPSPGDFSVSAFPTAAFSRGCGPAGWPSWGGPGGRPPPGWGGGGGPAAGKVRKLYSPGGRLPAPGYLPKPRKLDLEGKFGQMVHAWVYPPANPDATVPEGELPPYVVWAHGGPASHADRRLDLEKAYFTSRGIGVIDVNY